MAQSAKTQLNGFIAKYPPEIGVLGKAAIAKLRKLLPPAVEMVYDNYNFLVIGFGPTERPSEAILSVIFFSRYVSLCFIRGVDLPDPQEILRGGGRQVRNVRLPDVATLDEPPVRELIAAAVERATPSFPSTGKNRLIIKSISAKQRPRRPTSLPGKRKV